MFQGILDVFQFEFMRNALAAGVLVSIACGIIGTYVVVNRVVFISGGIAHSAYGGIGIGYFLGVEPGDRSHPLQPGIRLWNGLCAAQDPPAYRHDHRGDVGGRDGDWHCFY